MGQTNLNEGLGGYTQPIKDFYDTRCPICGSNGHFSGECEFEDVEEKWN